MKVRTIPALVGSSAALSMVMASTALAGGHSVAKVAGIPLGDWTWVGIVGVVLTFAQAAIAAMTVSTFRHTKTAALAAKVEADLALEEARRTRRTERPFLFAEFDELNFVPGLGPNGGSRFNLAVRNIGCTPGFLRRFWWRTTDGQPATWPRTQPDAECVVSNCDLVIGPQVLIRIMRNITVEAPQFTLCIVLEYVDAHGEAHLSRWAVTIDSASRNMDHGAPDHWQHWD